MDASDDRHWKVGELAGVTGVTVRALHHYDEIGLLVPSQRTSAGHRLYAGRDVRRLYRILAWRRLGVGLEEIASLLDDGSVSLLETVRRHLDQVELGLVHQHRLRERLRKILDALERSAQPSVEEYIDALEAMSMIEAVVDDVLMRVPNDEGHRVLLLKERGGERMLQIWVGAPAGDALGFQRVGREFPRPGVYDLSAKLVQAGGVRVERVVIESVRGNTFYATVVVSADGESREVDARPSDALNLAVRLGVPIFVASEVMERAGLVSRHEFESRLNRADAGLRRLGESEGEWRSVTPELISSLHSSKVVAWLERQMTEPARQALSVAQAEARALGHDQITPEHILLGLLAEANGLAIRILESLEITPQRVRTQAMRIDGSDETLTTGQIPFSPRATRLVEWALRPAPLRAHDVSPEHILLALADANDTLLLDLDVDAQRIRDEVFRAQAASPQSDARPNATHSDSS